MKTTTKLIATVACAATVVACTAPQERLAERASGFPFSIPAEKPDFAISSSMEASYDRYAATPQQNELYSVFRFSPITGFDYHYGDGTMSRRDPTRVIKVGDTYYMWYTLRVTPDGAPARASDCTETIPSVDWDLSDIGYATSKDGFNWVEQGVAVHRPEAPTVGFRSISTPEILVWKGKYYLYYQAFEIASGTVGDNCPVAMAEADSPDGPWTRVDKVILPVGEEGSWDQFNIHDPLPVVMNDKIYMYYKADWNYLDESGKKVSTYHIRSMGVAVGDSPYGPFVKSPLNPVLSSGHETQLFRFKEGVAAILTRDGNEHYTVQYSPDGFNFKQASIGGLMPDASGLYDPDAFTNTKDGRGITWGICHVNKYSSGSTHSVMFRFDCDLSQDVNDPEMKINHIRPVYEDFMKQGLTKKQKESIPGAKSVTGAKLYETKKR